MQKPRLTVYLTRGHSNSIVFEKLQLSFPALSLVFHSRGQKSEIKQKISKKLWFWSIWDYAASSPLIIVHSGPRGIKKLIRKLGSECWFLFYFKNFEWGIERAWESMSRQFIRLCGMPFKKRVDIFSLTNLSKKPPMWPATQSFIEKRPSFLLSFKIQSIKFKKACANTTNSQFYFVVLLVLLSCFILLI